MNSPRTLIDTIKGRRSLIAWFLVELVVAVGLLLLILELGGDMAAFGEWVIVPILAASFVFGAQVDRAHLHANRKSSI